MATTAASDNTSSSNPWSGVKLRHVKRPSIIKRSCSSVRRRPPLNRRSSTEEAPAKPTSPRDVKTRRPAGVSTGVSKDTKVNDKLQWNRPATAITSPAKGVGAGKPWLAATANSSPESIKVAVTNANRIEARAKVSNLATKLKQKDCGISRSSPSQAKNLVPPNTSSLHSQPVMINSTKDNNSRASPQKKPTIQPRPVVAAKSHLPMPDLPLPPLPSQGKREEDRPAGVNSHRDLGKRASADTDSWIDIDDSLSPKENESHLFNNINKNRFLNMWKKPSKKKISGGKKLESQTPEPIKKAKDWETDDDSDEHSYEYIDFRGEYDEEYSDVIVPPEEEQPSSQRKESESSIDSYEDIILPPPKPPRKLNKKADNVEPVVPPRRKKEVKSKTKPLLPPKSILSNPPAGPDHLEANYELVEDYVDMDHPQPAAAAQKVESRSRSGTGVSDISNASSSGSDPYIGAHQLASSPPMVSSVAATNAFDRDDQVYLDVDSGPAPRPQSYFNVGGLAELERMRQRGAAAGDDNRVSYVKSDQHRRPPSLLSLQYEDPDQSTPPSLKTGHSQPNLGALNLGVPKRGGRKSRYVKQEPLFQNYQEDFVERHRKSNKEEEDSPSISIRIKTANSHLQSIQRTLWCQLPEVIQSNVLQSLTDKQKKLQEAMFEVITSEASYLRSLNVLVNIFMRNPELRPSGPLLNKIQFNHLFSNVDKVRDVSERFLLHLEAVQQENVVIDDLCDIIKIHAQKYFSVYISYTKNQRYQDIALKQLLQESPQFKEVIGTLEKDPECASQKLSSFLILPMQRITRLPLLIEAIFHRTEEGSKQYLSATEAHIVAKEIVRKCNEATREMERVQEMVEIQRQLKFDKIKGLGIISAARWVVKKGKLERISEQSSGLLSKQRKVVKEPLHFFIFTDILIVCTQKRGDEDFAVMDHCVRSLIDVEAIEDKPTVAQLPFPVPDNCNNLFRLGLLENYKRKSVNFILNAPSLSERQRWMEAFSPGTAEDSDERIYESWDCPQVQCIKRYKARQADELDLEEADIVNVVKKLSDGWYEGIRVGDNQKGWFPSEYTEEIFNEHVKSRNLKLRNKLLMASEELIKNRQSLSNFL